MERGQALSLVCAALLVATLGVVGIFATVGAGPVERPDSVNVVPNKHYLIPNRTPDSDQIVLRISLDSQLLIVLEGGVPIAWSAVTTGAAYAPTPIGRFAILDRARQHRSRDFGGAQMPHMLKLTEGGVAIHGGRLMTKPASGGCVRVPEEFAAWLFGVTRLGTVVEIES